MGDSQLTPYLLDKSLLQYTHRCTEVALAPNATSPDRIRARLALEFFVSLFDPAVDSERKCLETFKNHLVALNNGNSTKIAPLSDLSISPSSNKLSSVQQVLSLPDTLSEILSHISPLSVDGRTTFHSAALVSRSFHYAADKTLWKTPRDLDTVEQQVHFAFGAAISAALGESLGNQVRGLRIRRMSGGWNERLIVKIAQLCPQVDTLLLHCGDVEDGEDPITQDFVDVIHTVLSSLPNVEDLSLVKFSYTPPVGQLKLPKDAHVPFRQLVSLRLYDFGWYWPAIRQGLGFSLKSLDFGLLPQLSSEELISLARQTSVVNLAMSSALELEPLREFVFKGLIEHLHIKQFFDHDEKYAEELISIATASLSSLKAFTLSGVEVGRHELELFEAFHGPLEEIGVQIREDVSSEDAIGMICRLVKSKRQSLKVIQIDFEGTFELKPTEELINNLADCPVLERILIPFASTTGISSTSVDALLKRCLKLELTWSLESLCEGNELYEREYKMKLELKESDDDGRLGA
ncbi:hypothetical protein CPB83DRAFT_910664 [Crepidotus variabilis]|uniref:Uncharacterized protein n=1 Tax=Crepidotus variabilis TaxID=179855 RepID=A0A9P6E6R9_9AGAR|nr:hypothetical protein CPB83DRAFT_910664 [Crepidotus variabilis]